MAGKRESGGGEQALDEGQESENGVGAAAHARGPVRMGDDS